MQFPPKRIPLLNRVSRRPLGLGTVINISSKIDDEHKKDSKKSKNVRLTMMHRFILLSLLLLLALLSSASAGGRSEVETTVRKLKKTINME
jgi:hypothetical protein